MKHRMISLSSGVVLCIWNRAREVEARGSLRYHRHVALNVISSFPYMATGRVLLNSCEILTAMGFPTAGMIPSVEISTRRPTCSFVLWSNTLIRAFGRQGKTN